MLCQHCKKKTATVHLTVVVNKEMQEKHLCEECASKEGEMAQSHEPIDQLVKKFVMSQGDAKELAQLTCPQCGLTFMQFRKSGLLGCTNDYEVFKEPLKGLLERAHGGHTEHVGKTPGGKENKHKKQHQLTRLKEQLNEAVNVEDYEKAANLRDEISTLEQS